MKEKQKIDDLFKNALSDYREELPSINTEGQIFRKLSYNKYLNLLKTNLGIYIIALPITIIAYFLFNNIDTNSNNSLSEAKETVVTHTETINNVIKVTKNENVNLNQNQKITQSKNKTIEFKKTITNQESYANNVSAIKTNNILIEKKQNKNIQNLSQILSNNIEKQTSKIITPSEKQDEKEENINPNSKQLSVGQTDAITAVLSNAEGQKKVLLTEKEAELSKDKAIGFTQDPEIKPVKNSITVDIKAIDSSSVQQNENNLKKKIITKSYNSFALELSGSLYYVDKKLIAGNELANTVKIRNENESKIITFSPSIELKFNTKHFFLQTGISYQMFGEKVDYNLTDIKTNINTILQCRDSLIYITDPINPPGYWIYDTLWFTKYDTTYLTTHRNINYINTYKYLEIPLLVGKSFAFNKFIIDVSTGVSLGVLLKVDAQILSADNTSIIGINDKRSPYMNDLTMNYLFRIAFRYSINEKWSVFARPSLKVNLGSILNENQYAIQQKYTLYGIGMGLMYKF